MSSRWREWIEKVLPWFDAALERRRDRHTEAIVNRAEGERDRAKRVIAEYREAAKVASHAGERVIDEVRRADDR